MAKKSLTNLMSGLMGDAPAAPEPVVFHLKPEAPVYAPEPAPTGRRGRPKTTPYVRATFAIDPVLLRQIRIASTQYGMSQKEILTTALYDWLSRHPIR